MKGLMNVFLGYLIITFSSTLAFSMVYCNYSDCLESSLDFSQSGDLTQEEIKMQSQILDVVLDGVSPAEDGNYKIKTADLGVIGSIIATWISTLKYPIEMSRGYRFLLDTLPYNPDTRITVTWYSNPRPPTPAEPMRVERVRDPRTLLNSRFVNPRLQRLEVANPQRLRAMLPTLDPAITSRQKIGFIAIHDHIETEGNRYKRWIRLSEGATLNPNHPAVNIYSTITQEGSRRPVPIVSRSVYLQDFPYELRRVLTYMPRVARGTIRVLILVGIGLGALTAGDDVEAAQIPDSILMTQEQLDQIQAAQDLLLSLQ